MKLTKYKRQYLISSTPIKKLSSWTNFLFNEYHIYLEKSLEYERFSNNTEEDLVGSLQSLFCPNN